jgi:hypothetical protein
MKQVTSPADEVFHVRDEVRAMAPMPLVFIEGALDTQSRARSLADLARGPHRYVSIPGGDKQFDEIRDTFFLFLDRSLAWIENPQGALAAPATPVPPAPGTAAPGPGAPGPAAPPPSR